jgi:hypothetical protein
VRRAATAASLAVDRVVRHAAFTLADAELARRKSEAAAMQDERRRQKLLTDADRDRAYARALRSGVEAWANGSIVRAVGSAEAPELEFGCIGGEGELRERLRPAWLEIWKFVMRMSREVEGRISLTVRGVLGGAQRQVDASRGILRWPHSWQQRPEAATNRRPQQRRKTRFYTRSRIFAVMFVHGSDEIHMEAVHGAEGVFVRAWKGKRYIWAPRLI